MIRETFVASDPKSAYDLAVAKYGRDIKLLSAKHISYDDGVIRSEITISIPQDVFLNASVINQSISSQIKSLFWHKGISKDWIDDILAPLEMMNSHILDNKEELVSYVFEEIDSALSIQKESVGEPKVIMLVGPTGVGKTTTIAKLSCRYQTTDRKMSLINLDSYKIGAFAQLDEYAKHLNIDHIKVEDIELFESNIVESNNDIILIDTVGVSPYDTQKFMKILQFAQTKIKREIEVHLVLSATTNRDDMDDTLKQFDPLDLDSVIFTKFDETKHFGNLLGFLLSNNLPMSYFCMGQDISTDIQLASKEYLLESFIGEIDYQH